MKSPRDNNGKHISLEEIEKATNTFEGWGEVVEELAMACKGNHELIKEFMSMVRLLATRLSALEIVVNHLEEGGYDNEKS